MGRLASEAMTPAGAGDGTLWDMKNLTSDLAPLLSARRPRYLVETLAKPNGLYAKDGLYWVDGTGFYSEGEKKGDVADGRKQFAALLWQQGFAVQPAYEKLHFVRENDSIFR